MAAKGSLQFDSVAQAPYVLKLWWEDLTKASKERVRSLLGDLLSLMWYETVPGLVEAAAHFWDYKRAVFHFNGIDLAPMIEEIAGLSGLAPDPETLICPRRVEPEEFFNFLEVPQEPYYNGVQNARVTLEFLYSRFGDTTLRYDFPGASEVEDWPRTESVAFTIAFLGAVIFPEKGGKIHTGIALVVEILRRDINRRRVGLIPMIVGDIYRALTKCKKGADYFEGCNLLLQIWLIEHLQKLEAPPSAPIAHTPDGIMTHSLRMTGTLQWEKPLDMSGWFDKLNQLREKDIQWVIKHCVCFIVSIQSQDATFLTLIGLRGTHHYIPLRILRQVGTMQSTPRLAEGRNLNTEIGNMDGVTREMILTIWEKRKTRQFCHHQDDRVKPQAALAYPHWLEFDKQRFLSNKPTLKRRIEATNFEEKYKKLRTRYDQKKVELKETQNREMRRQYQGKAKEEETRFWMNQTVQLRHIAGSLKDILNSWKGHFLSTPLEDKEVLGIQILSACAKSLDDIQSGKDLLESDLMHLEPFIEEDPSEEEYEEDADDDVEDKPNA